MRIPQFLAMSFALASMASAQIVVSHMSVSASNPTNQPKPNLKLENQGGTVVDLSKITLDYLIYESGLLPTALVADCWYVTTGTCSDITAEFASIPLQEDGPRRANLRIRIGFAKGSLAPGQNLTLQWGYHEQAYQRQFTETDDWSFTQSNGQWNVDSRVAVNASGAGLPMVWKGLVPTLPLSGKAGDVVYSQTQKASSVYDGTAWILVSEIGKQGPAGAVGEQGAQGPVGATGAQGPTGLQGPQGQAGETGAVGAQGAQGIAGPAGADGARGEQGTQGVPGLPGEVGPKGEKGDVGPVDNTALALIAALTARVAKLEGGSTEPSSFTDSRDSKVYKIAKIGTGTWMAENLNYAGPADNTVGKCYGDDVARCAKYGRLYTWATMMSVDTLFDTTVLGEATVKHKGLCPEGWHVPNDAEWTELITEVGKKAGAGQEGAALKATSGWNPNGSVSGNGTDAFGFAALPGGYRNLADVSYSAAAMGYWWSATESSDGKMASHRRMNNTAASVALASLGKKFKFSVRCRKD